MKSLRLRTDGLDRTKMESLALPFHFVGPTVTDDDGSRQPGATEAAQYRAVRVVHHPDGAVVDERPEDEGYLTLVVSGTVEVSTAYMTAHLEPGDVLWVDGAGSDGYRLTHRGACARVDVLLDPAWTPSGVVPPVVSGWERPATAPRLREMFVAEEKAHLRDLGGPFTRPASGSTSSQWYTTTGATFLCLSPDSFGDWHTESATSLVVVLAGVFELEVGGAGGAQGFRAGDVCLVQDDHGQGHITRTLGETRFVAIGLPADHSLLTP